MTRYIAIIALVTLVALGSCGSRQAEPGDSPTVGLMPESFDSLGITRSSEVQLFVGEDLYEHINGGAEVYHPYGFIDVATAYYQHEAGEMMLDLYRFETTEGAYGLYSTLLPEQAEWLEIGIEGFASPTSVDFVKGDLVVRITGYDETDAASAALKDFARAVASSIPGTTAYPLLVLWLHQDKAVPHTGKLTAVSYLGIDGLDWVFHRQYDLGHEDPLFLFIAHDPDSAKVKALRASNLEPAPEGLDLTSMPFMPDKLVAREHFYYGTIAASSADSLMLGAAGVTARNLSFVNWWLGHYKRLNR